MPYCTLADLKLQVPEEDLAQLTDDAAGASVSTPVLARAIADADAEIEGYLRARYVVPMAPVPEIVRRVSVDLTIFNLYSRRFNTDDGVPDAVQARWENAIKTLTRISSGAVTLPTTATTTADSDQILTDKTEDDRDFTAEVLDLF